MWAGFALGEIIPYNEDNSRILRMEEPIKNAVKPRSSLDDFRAENMAYASQSVVVNIAANVVEPWLNKKWQRYSAKRDLAQYNQPKGQRYGSYWQNLGGELIGDVGGGTTLFLASAFAPGVTQGFINFTGRLVHPIFHTLGHIAFKEQFNEPDYAAKVNKWADFQEKNFARSLIVAAGNISSNVAGQKYLIKNPSPAKVIFQGKLMTTALTNSLMLFARIYAPQRMKNFDRRMGKKYFESDNGGDKQQQSPQPQQQVSYADRVGQFNPYDVQASHWDR